MNKIIPLHANLRQTLLAVSMLYFIFGFITCLNDILVPHLRAVFALTYAQAALIQFSFFMAYFIMSVPSGRLVDRVGYQLGMVGGLATAGLGCLLFYPAAGLPSYPVFLVALFILASGITLLQVAGNPYVSLLGAPEGASARLTLAGAFNSLGTTLAPLFGALVILGGAAGARLAAGEPQAHRLAEAAAVRLPYLGLALTLFLLAAGTWGFRMPMGAARPEVAAGPAGLLDHLRQHPPLLYGAIGIFMYVGAEVAISSFLVNYISLPAIGGIPLAAAARYVAIYWGGAMVGRFVGSAVMRVVPPSGLLVFNAVTAIVLVLTALVTGGRVAMAAILAVGFFNSIMFPTIFVLAIKGNGARMGQASGLLCMAIVGGALVPVLQGLVADALGMRVAFLLPVCCYAYIAAYGAKARALAWDGGGDPAG